jgi:MPBQ/MSBQ methyltransferase
MTSDESALKECLKERLLKTISAQVDAIGYAPGDIARLTGGFDFATDAGVQPDAAPSPPPATTDEAVALAGRINAYYDYGFFNPGVVRGVLGATDYGNIGYWDETTTTLHQASERLQDELLSFIPEKSGRILDVACGMGASTRRLLNHYPAENVWAINISEKQIEATRKNAPGCHAEVMNAVNLTFEDGFFDNIMCIEAAFHFETRRKFLEEARRVLKPGGRLVLSDVLFTSSERLEQFPVFPSVKNHLATVAEYDALLEEAGFRNCIVRDARKEIWVAHLLYLVRRAHEAFCERKLNLVDLTEMLWTYYLLDAITGPCLFVSAQK